MYVYCKYVYIYIYIYFNNLVEVKNKFEEFKRIFRHIVLNIKKHKKNKNNMSIIFLKKKQHISNNILNKIWMFCEILCVTATEGLANI